MTQQTIAMYYWSLTKVQTAQKGTLKTVYWKIFSIMQKSISELSDDFIDCEPIDLTTDFESPKSLALCSSLQAVSVIAYAQ
jgi:hypothetical protein